MPIVADRRPVIFESSIALSDSVFVSKSENDSNWCGISTGIGDDFDISNGFVTTLVDGLSVCWKADRSCGAGPVRLQLNDLGYFPAKKGGSYELSLPDIVAGEVILCVYDGSQWNAIAGVGDNPVDGGVF